MQESKNGFAHEVDRLAQELIDANPGSTLSAAYREVAINLSEPSAPLDKAQDAREFWLQWQEETGVRHHTIDDWPIQFAEAYVRRLRSQPMPRSSKQETKLRYIAKPNDPAPRGTEVYSHVVWDNHDKKAIAYASVFTAVDFAGQMNEKGFIEP